jgi:hypothetical protein
MVGRHHNGSRPHPAARCLTAARWLVSADLTPAERRYAGREAVKLLAYFTRYRTAKKPKNVRRVAVAAAFGYALGAIHGAGLD